MIILNIVLWSLSDRSAYWVEGSFSGSFSGSLLTLVKDVSLRFCQAVRQDVPGALLQIKDPAYSWMNTFSWILQRYLEHAPLLCCLRMKGQMQRLLKNYKAVQSLRAPLKQGPISGMSLKICQSRCQSINMEIMVFWAYFHFLASSVMTVKQLICVKAEVCIRINVILTVRVYVKKGLL